MQSLCVTGGQPVKDVVEVMDSCGGLFLKEKHVKEDDGDEGLSESWEKCSNLSCKELLSPCKAIFLYENLLTQITTIVIQQ